ncbi:hypothetical protein TRV_04864 [Trichophyton verrucosum HKI 0517]|uniref:Uncharacterized protein n=1 Tax=Trichophyton verrucosum (strain HKI 0517) TaxID=663202 RepID=D4DCK9_TRIVH|nr:uncharacterized protein TRV_04864 [Trichophyton verrucosum HKI 0517]EFE40381.1 hypothetical protein TRV_04864 [Trichophyton verrucosum HKI 0517]
MHAVCGMHGGMRGRQILSEVNAEKYFVEAEAEEDIQLDEGTTLMSNIMPEKKKFCSDLSPCARHPLSSSRSSAFADAHQAITASSL